MEHNVRKDDERMKVIVKEPQKKPYTADIENTLEALQGIVGGYIETYPTHRSDALFICNEEGKLLGLPWNFTIRNEKFVGTVVCVGFDGVDDFCDCPISIEEFELKVIMNI